MAGPHGCRRALRSRPAAPSDSAGWNEPMGSSAAAGRREIVHLRRKNGDDVLCWPVHARDPAVEREQSEIRRVYRNWRVSADSPQRLRKNGNPPATGDGSSRRREGGEIGE